MFRGKRLSRRCNFDALEDRRMLAILWSNEFGANNFNIFNDSEIYAREIVNRAIDDWEAVIDGFNYAVDDDGDPNNDLDDTFSLDIFADQITGRGVTQNIQFGQEKGSELFI